MAFTLRELARVWYQTIWKIPQNSECGAPTKEMIDILEVLITAMQTQDITIIDNLESELTTAALSANQGRVLKSLIEEVKEGIVKTISLGGEKLEPDEDGNIDISGDHFVIVPDEI